MIHTLRLSKQNRTLLALLLSVCLLVIGQANAAGMFCRSDPIVYLSDGTRLQFSTQVETSLADLIGIHYELHVPIGVQINRIIYTPGWAQSKEMVELIADQPAGRYQITTVAQTGTPNIPTTVQAMMVARRNGGQGSTHAVNTGNSGQAIVIAF